MQKLPWFQTQYHPFALQLTDHTFLESANSNGINFSVLCWCCGGPRSCTLWPSCWRFHSTSTWTSSTHCSFSSLLLTQWKQRWYLAYNCVEITLFSHWIQQCNCAVFLQIISSRESKIPTHRCLSLPLPSLRTFLLADTPSFCAQLELNQWLS